MRLAAILSAAALLALSACGSGENSEATDQLENAGGGSDEGEAEVTDAVATATEAGTAAGAATTSGASAASAYPRIPMFNATCGSGIEVHGDEGGRIFVDGEEANLKKFNDNYFEATRGDTTISISFNPDNSLSLSYTGPSGAHGVCTLS